MDLVFPFLTSPSLYLFPCSLLASALLVLSFPLRAPAARGSRTGSVGAARPREEPEAPRLASGSPSVRHRPQRSWDFVGSGSPSRSHPPERRPGSGAARSGLALAWPRGQRGRPATHTHKPQAPTQWDSARRHRPRTTQAHRASQPNPATNTEINKCHAQPQTYTYTTLTEHRHNGHIRDHSTHTPTSTHMITRCKHT